MKSRGARGPAGRAIIGPMTRLALTLLAAALLAACGQKGALYLPDDAAAAVKVTPPAPATPDDAPDRSNEPRKRIH